ncbi:MAG TPA: HAD family hydrolase [Jatrophihabitans sp.]|jgi:putative hydrolase of the HAD superfamily
MRHALPPVSAVIFDWGGTLTPWHDIDPIAQWLAAVDDGDAAQRLDEAAAVVWARSRDEHRSATLEEVFTLAGVTPSARMTDAFYEWWQPHSITDPDAHVVLRGLRERGIKVGVLSNTIWARREHERIFERDGLTDLIDGAIYTSEIPWTKPHPEAFRAALAAIGDPEPRRTVFVGDRPFDDIYGASAVGMRTILVPHSTIPSDQIGHTEGDPDAVAHRLADVLGIVTEWNETVSDREHA